MELNQSQILNKIFLVHSGLAKMKQEMSTNQGDAKEEQEFVTSCMHTVDGVQKYIRNFGFLAGYMAQKNEFPLSNAQRDNLKKVSIKLVIYSVT